MSAGRPKGTGRWSDFGRCQLWARLTLLQEAEDIGPSRACDKLAYRGYWQARDGKYWLSNPEKVGADPRLSRVVEIGRPGDARSTDPAEAFRHEYYAAKRKRESDADFRAGCDFWLAVFRRERELRDAGTDPQEAMEQAFSETPFPTP